MNPFFSVVIPTHNRPAQLIEAVQSVFGQSSNDWELIVVDDGSREESSKILEPFADPRLTCLRHDQARGVAAARNTGYGAARGEIIAFLDDDDHLRARYLDAVRETFARLGDDIDFVWPVLVHQTPKKGYRSTSQKKPCVIRRGVGCEAAFAVIQGIKATGMAFRREALHQAGGFDERLAVSEDRDLVFRMLAQGAGCAQIGEALVNFLVHDGPRLSTSENLKRQAETDHLLATRHRAFLDAHPALAVRFLNMLARRQYQAGQRDLAMATLDQVLSLRPLDLRARRRKLVW